MSGEHFVGWDKEGEGTAVCGRRLTSVMRSVGSCKGFSCKNTLFE